MSADRDELRRLAMAATQGPWMVKDYGAWEGVVIEGTGIGYAIARCMKPHLRVANAAYIAAANPATVLRLLDELDATTPVSDDTEGAGGG